MRRSTFARVSSLAAFLFIFMASLLPSIGMCCASASSAAAFVPRRTGTEVAQPTGVRCAAGPLTGYGGTKGESSARIIHTHARIRRGCPRCGSGFRPALRMHRRRGVGESGSNSPTRFDFRLFERDADDGREEQLPGWIRSLINWQSQPSLPKLANAPSPMAEEEQEAPKESRVLDPVPVPLASLINVEALLMASKEEGNLDGLDATVPFVSPGRNDDTKKIDSAKHRKDEDGVEEAVGNATTPSTSTLFDLFPTLEELGDWDRLVQNLQQSLGDTVDETNTTTNTAVEDISTLSSDFPPAAPPDLFLPQVMAADAVLRNVTSRVASLLDDTSTAWGPAAIQDLVIRASNALAIEERSGGLREVADAAVRAAEKLAQERGLDVSDAARRTRETTRYTEAFLRVANGVLVSGYVQGDGRGAAGVARTLAIKEGKGQRASLLAADPLQSRPLFDDFTTACSVKEEKDRRRAVTKAAEMATLAGAVYQDTIDGVHKVGHALVKRGTTADVAWMVTDSVGYEDDFRDVELSVTSDRVDSNSPRNPIMVRTITIRGFDASDESVDREKLLNRVCTADPVPLGTSGVSVHRGLLTVARRLFNDITEYVDRLAPGHRAVLNGHSIGGSLSVLVLMLLVEKRGVGYVQNKFLRVFTFGSPPISILTENIPRTNEGMDTGIEKKGTYPFSLDSLIDKRTGESGDNNRVVPVVEGGYECEVLGKLGLPADMVYGYVQPWDPIIRLFSSADALYPLVGDIGEDGKTLWSSGPQRALRPITRAIIESWDGWSRFRDNWGPTGMQSYVSTGIQHILLPEPIRYLTDRLVGANVAIPPVDTVVRISSAELLPGLEKTHPLDVFAISFVPTALRSFIHHFYPAYADAFAEYALGVGNKKAVQKKETRSSSSKGGQSSFGAELEDDDSWR